jgi:hypothetical protein
MAMPMPRPPVNTNAVSTTSVAKSDSGSGRPSDLMPSLAPQLKPTDWDKQSLASGRFAVCVTL